MGICSSTFERHGTIPYHAWELRIQQGRLRIVYLRQQQPFSIFLISLQGIGRRKIMTDGRWQQDIRTQIIKYAISYTFTYAKM